MANSRSLLGSFMVVFIAGLAMRVAAADAQGCNRKLAGIATGEEAIMSHEAPASAVKDELEASTATAVGGTSSGAHAPPAKSAPPLPTANSTSGGPARASESGLARAPVTNDNKGPEKKQSSSVIPDWLEKMLIAVGSAAAVVAVEEGMRRFCWRRCSGGIEAGQEAPASTLPTTYNFYRVEFHEHKNSTAAEEADGKKLIGDTPRSDDIEMQEV